MAKFFQVWPYLNSLIIIKLHFSQQEHVQILTLPLSSKTCVLPFNFALERDSKISFIISMTQRIIRTRSSIFCYLIDMNIYIQNLPVCNSGQHTYVAGLFNFFFVLQDLIDRIDSYFQRIAFQRNLLLIGF